MLYARIPYASNLILPNSSQLNNDIKTESQLPPNLMLPDSDKTKSSLFLKSNLKLFFQFLSKRAQLFQALTQVHMTVEFNKGLDEVRNTPFGFHFIPAEMKEKFS